MHILELLHPNHTSVPTTIMLAMSCADLAIARLELLTYGTVWWGGLTLPLMPHSVRCVPSPSIVLCHCIHTLRNVNWLWPVADVKLHLLGQLLEPHREYFAVLNITPSEAGHLRESIAFLLRPHACLPMAEKISRNT